MTSQEKLDSINALFQQAEAELKDHKPIIGLDLYSSNLDQTELRSTTIKTVHEIHSIEKSLSINKSETKSHEEITKTELAKQKVETKSEQRIRIRKRIDELYELALKDNKEQIGDQPSLGTEDPIFLKEKETEISAAMAEIADTVKAIPAVQDRKLSAEQPISPDLKSQIFKIVETATRDIIKNEVRHILEDMLPKRLENRPNISKKKAKKTQAKKTQAKKTQAKKTQAKKTQARKTQARKTQAKKTQARKTQARKTQARKTQARK